MIEVDLSEFPKEVSAFPFDQLEDRLHEKEMDTEGVELDYDSMVAFLPSKRHKTVLRAALREKIRDIEWEVEHNERSDFSRQDVRNMKDLQREL